MASTLTNKISGLAYRNLLKSLARQKTREVIKPTKPSKKVSATTHISVYDYTPAEISNFSPPGIEACFPYIETPSVTWINMDNLSADEMELMCNTYRIHWLIQEDITTYGQRPKVDEIEGVLFCLLNMLFVNEQTGVIQQEQISVVLGKNYVLSFQEDAEKDVFDPIRKRLLKNDSRERERGADYLFYSLIDIITDSYLTVVENIGYQIEQIEESILQKATKHTFEKISQLRKDIILLKRNIAPVKDLAASLVRSDSELMEEKTAKYFKDVHDHVAQANDLIDNYRDLILGVQDMYVNNINLRMNEVMKTLAIITSIMAPATVIGGIFGMNFDIIPYAHHEWGFFGTVALMVLIPIIMIIWFSKRGWFQKEYATKKNTDDID